MNSSAISIDARGLECPRPVMLVRKAILEGRPGLIEVAVDTQSARANIARFAAIEGYSCGKVELADGSATLTLRTAASNSTAASNAATPATPTAVTVSAAPAPAEAALRGAPPTPQAASGRARTVFIARDAIGAPPSLGGDFENNLLGRVLMRSFLFALGESEIPPERIILMNSGVFLACEGSDSLANLKKLEVRGVAILACGTCLQQYGLTESLIAGRVSNMYEIAEILLEGSVIAP